MGELFRWARFSFVLRSLSSPLLSAETGGLRSEPVLRRCLFSFKGCSGGGQSKPPSPGWSRLVAKSDRDEKIGKRVSIRFLFLTLLASSCSLNVFDRSPRLNWENGGVAESGYWNEVLQTELDWETQIAKFGAGDEFGNSGGARCAVVDINSETSTALRKRLLDRSRPTFVDLEVRRNSFGKFSSCMDAFQRQKYLPFTCGEKTVWFHLRSSLGNSRSNEPFDLYLCEMENTSRIFVTRKLFFSDGR